MVTDQPQRNAYMRKIRGHADRDVGLDALSANLSDVSAIMLRAWSAEWTGHCSQAVSLSSAAL
jgi:hypothetical protein